MSEPDSSHPHSYLFTVRLWKEDMGDASKELRGEVRHVLSGEVHYFRNWHTLLEYLAGTLDELDVQREGGGGM